jgi:hypothetical protein
VAAGEERVLHDLLQRRAARRVRLTHTQGCSDSSSASAWRCYDTARLCAAGGLGGDSSNNASSNRPAECGAPGPSRRRTQARCRETSTRLTECACTSA